MKGKRLLTPSQVTSLRRLAEEPMPSRVEIEDAYGNSLGSTHAYIYEHGRGRIKGSILCRNCSKSFEFDADYESHPDFSSERAMQIIRTRIKCPHCYAVFEYEGRTIK